MIQAAKSHDRRQHSELWVLLHHADVHCRYSQDWQDIVPYLLGIRGSGRPEIFVEACKDDQSLHFGFNHFWHYLLNQLSRLRNVVCSSRIGVWILRKQGNMHSPRFLDHILRFVHRSLQHDTFTYISPPSPLWMYQREAQKLPAFLHFHSYFFSLVLATSIITYSAYNCNGGWDCLVAASPLGCDDKDSGVDCIRGTNAKNIRFLYSCYTTSSGRHCHYQLHDSTI